MKFSLITLLLLRPQVEDHVLRKIKHGEVMKKKIAVT